MVDVDEGEHFYVLSGKCDWDYGRIASCEPGTTVVHIVNEPDIHPRTFYASLLTYPDGGSEPLECVEFYRDFNEGVGEYSDELYLDVSTLAYNQFCWINKDATKEGLRMIKEFIKRNIDEHDPAERAGVW